MSEWVAEEYPRLGSAEHALLQECVIHPGELLYFPSKWMHATLNLDVYNVFVSLFLDTQLIEQREQREQRESHKMDEL
jgi:ribosomal protein L16 Arg81 hydroxylase